MCGAAGDGDVIVKPCRVGAMWGGVEGGVDRAVSAPPHTGLLGYTNEFKEFMALIGDGASELSWPTAVSLLALFPLYWPINEPSSLNCPSPPSP